MRIEGVNISTDENLDLAVTSCGRETARVLAQATQPDIEDALALQTERAKSLKLFGAPSFVVGDELFWGDDRLEDAIDWAASH